MLSWSKGVLVRALLPIALMWLAIGVHMPSFLDSAWAGERRGIVVDATSVVPIAGATVTLGDQSVLTDEHGEYQITGSASQLRIRAPGYRREDVSVAVVGQDQKIMLEPFVPKALYLSVYGIGSKSLREPALGVIQKGGLNALVIDLKGDRGLIPYASAVSLAAPAGALKVRTIADLDGLVTSLNAKGLYTIARIVVFKDDLLAQVRQDWAVRTKSGTVWKDREGLSWIDPFRKEAWGYAIGIAEEAAASGFDEIQFDYARFPDASGLSYSQPLDQAARVGAITGFLSEARRRLIKYNVFLAVDVFGYVCWNSDDTHIGQRLEDLAPLVDYISPMLYPSSFQFGIPGFRNPVTHPYEIVYRSLETARTRTADSTVRYRPWLQAFRDYAFGGHMFGGAEIGAQVKAAQDAGAIGWMLWNPHNVYSIDGLSTVETSLRH